MKSKILLIFILFFSYPSFCVSEEEIFGPPIAVYGLGKDATCGSYIRSLKNNNEYSIYYQYSAGIITGRNMGDANDGNILSGSNFNDAMLWVENFCRKNPLKSFLGSLHVLIITVNDGR